MTKFVMRLDDACEYRDIEKWNRMEDLLLKYDIMPLVGVIPHCEDASLIKYGYDSNFWCLAQNWVTKGWVLALHGYNHVYNTKDGGINPINLRSEFAGNTFECQCDKIEKGIKILNSHGIEPQVFFAPSHTFDENTLIALKEKSSIRFISDTIAYGPYTRGGFTFVPQQSGSVRSIPFDTVTFCYHPNTMQDIDFKNLENFLKVNRKKFIKFPLEHVKRRFGLIDYLLKFLYFLRRK